MISNHRNFLLVIVCLLGLLTSCSPAAPEATPTIKPPTITATIASTTTPTSTISPSSAPTRTLTIAPTINLTVTKAATRIIRLGASTTLSINSSLWSLKWSPDSRYLLIKEHITGMNIWDASTGKLTRRDENGGDWSRDNKKFALSTNTSIKIMSADVTTVIRTWSVDERVVDLDWLSDSKTLIATFGTKIVAYDAETGKILYPIASKNEWGTHLFGTSISPDGKYMATVGNELMIWDIAQKKKKISFADARSMVWAPDSVSFYADMWSHVGFLKLDGSVSQVIKLDLTNAEADELLALSPNGQVLALTQFTFMDLVDLMTQKIVMQLTDRTDKNIYAVAFSPDGKYLAFCGSGGKVLINGVTFGQ